MMKTLLTPILLAVCILLGTTSFTYEVDPLTLPSSEFTERYFIVPPTPTNKAQRCLTQALYYEAGNQSPIGKEAVALVILNRVGSKGYPRTICGVIRQAKIVGNRKICQFSFWCEKKRKPVQEVWQESEKIALRVLQNYWKRDILSTYSNALFFHADYVRPKWRTQKIYLGKIDNHLFYGERPKGDRS